MIVQTVLYFLTPFYFNIASVGCSIVDFNNGFPLETRIDKVIQGFCLSKKTNFDEDEVLF